MDQITQIGVGGIFAVLVLQMVFKFLAQKRNGGKETAGDKTVEFWQAQQRASTKEVLRDELAPFLASQTEILREIRESTAQTRDGVRELVRNCDRGIK